MFIPARVRSIQRMATWTVVAIAASSLMACAQVPQTDAGKLVEIDIKDLPVENGKKLNAIFREVERAEDYSIAEYRVFSGGSVSSSLFPVRAACVWMKRREKPFLFIAKPADDSKIRRMRVEFPKVRTVAFGDGTNGLSLSLDECAMFGTME